MIEQVSVKGSGKKDLLMGNYRGIRKKRVGGLVVPSREEDK